MNNKEMLNEEQVFDILDGLATEEILKQHKHLMSYSEVYHKYFRELEAIHLDLMNMPLEKPSADFAENVMAAIPVPAVVITAHRKKAWGIKMAYAFMGTLFLVVAAAIILALVYGRKTDANGGLSIPFFNEFSSFLASDFIKIAGLLNLIVLLVIFDRRVLRPYFDHKRITLG